MPPTAAGLVPRNGIFNPRTTPGIVDLGDGDLDGDKEGVSKVRVDCGVLFAVSPGEYVGFILVPQGGTKCMCPLHVTTVVSLAHTDRDHINTINIKLDAAQQNGKMIR